MGYRWTSNTPRDRFEDPPMPDSEPDADSGEHLDADHQFAAGASGRRPRNRSNRWGQR